MKLHCRYTDNIANTSHPNTGSRRATMTPTEQALEIWKDIEGYEGKYQVSNMGRVKSLPRKHSPKEKIENE